MKKDGILNKLVIKSSKAIGSIQMIKKLYSYFLSEYSEENFLQHQRATMLFTLCGLIFVAALAMLFGNVLIAGNTDPILIAALFTGTTVIMSTLILIKKGHYILSSHIVLVLLPGMIWAVLFFDSNPDVINRIDTISLILGVMILMPLILNKKGIIIHSSINIFLFFLFVAVHPSVASLPELTRKDYIADNTVALLFIFTISLLIHSLHRKSLERSDSLFYEEKKKTRGLMNITDVCNEVCIRLAESVKDMTSTSRNFIESSHLQAASTEQITSSMEEISAGSDGIFDLVITQYSELKNATSKIESVYNVVIKESEEVKKLISLKDRLNTETETTRNNMENVVDFLKSTLDQFDEVKEVISIINDISDKINLLSLNAAIEAARAGDAGRGFAVVADEIGKLADTTAQNVKVITDMISASSENLTKSFNAMKNFIQVTDSMIQYIMDMGMSVDSIGTLSAQDREFNEQIMKSTDSVIKLSESVKTSIEEQKTGIDEIVKTLSVINEATQKISENSENLVTTSNKVEAVSNELQENIILTKTEIIEQEKS